MANPVNYRGAYAGTDFMLANETCSLEHLIPYLTTQTIPFYNSPPSSLSQKLPFLVIEWVVLV